MEREPRHNRFRLPNDETHMLDGYVRGLMLGVVSIEFVGQRRMVHGGVLQGSDALLQYMIVRPFDLVGLTIGLLVRERVLPQTGDTRLNVGVTCTGEIHSRGVRAVMQRVWISVNEMSMRATTSETFLVRLTVVGSCYSSKPRQGWRSVKRQ